MRLLVFITYSEVFSEAIGRKLQFESSYKPISFMYANSECSFESTHTRMGLHCLTMRRVGLPKSRGAMSFEQGTLSSA